MAECIILKGGGGADLDAVTAESSDVLAGKVTVDKDGEPLTGTLELSGNVSNDQVLAGRSYYSTDPKNKQTGSMPNYSSTPTAIDAIRINNNRFEVAVAKGFHGYNWAGGGYEYMSYEQVANSIGLTPDKLKKGVWVCGRTGTFEGYVPSPTDLYLRGNNIAGWISTTADYIKFDSGQITSNANSTQHYIYTGNTINLTGYTRINIEGYAPRNIRCIIQVNTANGRYIQDNSTADFDSYVGPGNFTTSLDISSINASRYIHANLYGGNIYRIWLS